MKPVKNQSTTVEEIHELRIRPSLPPRYYHYRCSICGRKTVTAVIMRRHLDKTHQIIINGDNLC